MFLAHNGNKPEWTGLVSCSHLRQAEGSKKFPASFDHPFPFSHLANKAANCTVLLKPTRFVQFQFCYILSTTFVGLPAKPPWSEAVEMPG